MSLEIGQPMDDGTIFIGVSPTNGRPLFRTPQCLFLEWDQANRHLQTTQINGHPAGTFRLGTEEELSILHEHWNQTGGFGPEPLPDDYGAPLLASSAASGKVFCISLETGAIVTAERCGTPLIICPLITKIALEI